MKTMLEDDSMRRPPHSTVAHSGRGVTPHCCWHLSTDSATEKGCGQYMSCSPSLEKGWKCSVHLRPAESDLFLLSSQNGAVSCGSPPEQYPAQVKQHSLPRHASCSKVAHGCWLHGLQLSAFGSGPCTHRQASTVGAFKLMASSARTTGSPRRSRPHRSPGWRPPQSQSTPAPACHTSRARLGSGSMARAIAGKQEAHLLLVAAQPAV